MGHEIITSRIKIYQVRYLIIPVLALIMAHLIAYGKLPYDPNYRFPLLSFLVILVVGLMVCETNRYNYNRLATRFPLTDRLYISALQRLGSNLLVTGLVFVVATAGLNLAISGALPPATRFLSYLFMVWLIILAETAVFVAFDLYKQNKQPSFIGVWQIASGKQLLQIKPGEVAYMISQRGIVVLITATGQKIITNFNSFRDMQQKLDCKEFFRLNRQYMVRATAVSKVVSETNRKLQVTITPPQNGIPNIIGVSRYKSAQFKQWLRSYQ